MQPVDATTVGSLIGSEWKVHKKCWSFLGLVGLSKAGSESKLQKYAADEKYVTVPPLTEDIAKGIEASGENIFDCFPAVRKEFMRIVISSSLSNKVLMRFIVLGLQDPWSATRKQTASLLRTELLENHSTELLSIIKLLSTNNRWEAIEGSLHLLKKICSCLRVVFQPPSQKVLLKNITMCETTSLRTLPLRLTKKTVERVNIILPVELLQFVINSLSHSQDSIREMSSNVIYVLMSTCTLSFSRIRLYNTVLSKALTPSLGALSAVHSSIQLFPLMCIKDTFYLTFKLFESTESLVRHRAANIASKCVAISRGLLPDCISLYVSQSQNWQVQEACMIVLEDILLQEIPICLSDVEKLAQWVITVKNSYTVDSPMPFETDRMRSQLVPHIARTFIQKIDDGKTAKKQHWLLSLQCGDFEWIFWTIWSTRIHNKTSLVSHIVSSEGTNEVLNSKPTSKDIFWKASVKLSLIETMSDNNDNNRLRYQQQLLTELKEVIKNHQHHPQLEHVFVRLLPVAIPHIIRDCHSSLIDILLLLLCYYSQANAQVNILTALKRIAVMSEAGDDSIVHFDSGVVQNITCLTNSYEQSWGTVRTPSLSINVLGNDSSKSSSRKRIFDRCCEVLSVEGSAQSAMTIAVKTAVLIMKDTSDRMQFLTCLCNRMDLESVFINSTTLCIQSSTTVTGTTHDWDLDTESDEEEEQEGTTTTIITKWIPDIKSLDVSDIPKDSKQYDLMRWVQSMSS